MPRHPTLAPHPEPSRRLAVWVDEPLAPWQGALLHGLPDPTLRILAQPLVIGAQDPYACLDRRLFGQSLAPTQPARQPDQRLAPGATIPPHWLTQSDLLLDLRLPAVLQQAQLPPVAVPVARIAVSEDGLDAQQAWYRGTHTLALTLEVRQPDGTRQQQFLARIATDRTSWQRTLRRIQASVLRWWPRVLARWPHTWSAPSPTAPSKPVPWLPVLAKTAGTLLTRKMRHHTVGQAWRIGIRKRNRALLPLQLADFHWLRTPRGAFDADPFLARDDRTSWLFFERMPPRSERGEIWVAPLAADGTPQTAHRVLRAPHHLAFPQVFRADGAWWMVPDSAGADGIQVFQARAFPDDWRLVDVWLPGGSWVDPVLHHDGQRWWLLATPQYDGQATSDELHAFWSLRLGAPWQPHPHNPVQADVRWARNAGRLQVHGGELWRPSQDCAQDYGAGMTLRRIEVLTPEDWQESTVLRVTARKLDGWDGVHTWNTDSEFEAIDVRLWLPGRVTALAANPGAPHGLRAFLPLV